MLNKDKVKIVIKLLAFLLGLILFMEVLSLLTMPKDNTEKSGSINAHANAIFTEPDHTIDVIAVGASNFWCGFDPMKLYHEKGYTSYNTGTLMEEVWYSYHFLKKVFQHQSPKVLFFDVDILFLEDTTGVDNLNSCIQNSLEWRLPVFAYHNRFKSLTKRDLDFRVNYTYHNERKGYYDQAATQAYTGDLENYMDQRFDNEKITWLNRLYFNQIKKLCDENGTRLVLVEAPAVLAWNHQRKEQINALAKENSLDFLDANEEMSTIDWKEDTRDGGFHLNNKGADKFTMYLAKYLTSLNLVTDKREAKGNERWKKDEQLYVKKIKTKS